jgi:hypothetical protein
MYYNYVVNLINLCLLWNKTVKESLHEHMPVKGSTTDFKTHHHTAVNSEEPAGQTMFFTWQQWQLRLTQISFFPFDEQ